MPPADGVPAPAQRLVVLVVLLVEILVILTQHLSWLVAAIRYGQSQPLVLRLETHQMPLLVSAVRVHLVSVARLTLQSLLVVPQ